MHKKAMLAVAVTVVVLFAAMTVQRHGIKTQNKIWMPRKTGQGRLMTKRSI